MSIGIVGFGNMGRAIGQSIASTDLWEVTAYDNYKVKTNNLKKIKIVKNAKELILNSSIVILAIKPHDVGSFIKENSVYFLKNKPTLISIAAGITTNYFQKSLKGIKIIRVMPNLAATVNESFSLICKGTLSKKSDLDISKKIFSQIGQVFITEESYLDKATSISGSGPGYIFYFMDIMYKSALTLGFNKKIAKKMVAQTFFGTSKLAKSSKKDFEQLSREVTSKKGTTEAALNTFEKYNLSSIIKEGIGNSYMRAKEISKIYTKNERS